MYYLALLHALCYRRACASQACSVKEAGVSTTQLLFTRNFWFFNEEQSQPSHVLPACPSPNTLLFCSTRFLYCQAAKAWKSSRNKNTPHLSLCLLYLLWSLILQCHTPPHWTAQFRYVHPDKTLALVSLDLQPFFPLLYFRFTSKKTTTCLLAVCIISSRSRSLPAPSSGFTSHHWCFCSLSILVSCHLPSEVLRNQMCPLCIALLLLELAQKSLFSPQKSPLEEFLTESLRPP